VTKYDEDAVSTTPIGASFPGDMVGDNSPHQGLVADGRDIKSHCTDLFDDLDLSRPGSAKNSDEQHSSYSEFEVDMKLGGTFNNEVAGRHGQSVRVTRDTSRTRRILLSWRLKPCYIAYCLLCLVASAFLFLYTLAQGHAADWKEDLYKEFTWVEAIELFLGVSIVAETSITYRVVGNRAFFRDKWCVFDLIISTLTGISWFFIFFTAQNWATHIEGDVEMPLLATRFGLQPLRVLSTFMALYKSRRMQKSQEDVHFEMVSLCDDIQMDAETVFRDVAVQIAGYLPVSLRFNQWYLAYSPKVHGLSINTLYRRMETAGDCLLIVKDRENCVFGGFSSGIRRHQPGGHQEVQDNSSCFVFDKRLMTHHYKENPMPPMYCDDKMISFGRALTIDADFLRGSSKPCNAYGTIEYLGSNDEFIIQNLEIWCFRPIIDEAAVIAEMKKEDQEADSRANSRANSKANSRAISRSSSANRISPSNSAYNDTGKEGISPV